MIEPLLLPPALLAIGMAACLWLLIRKKWRAGKILLAIVLLVFYLLSTGPGSYLLCVSLGKTLPVGIESIPSVALLNHPPEAIVILAGGVVKKGRMRPFDELSGTSWKRLWLGIELYWRFEGRVPILYSGGSGDPFDRVPVEPALAARYALAMGISPSDFWMESASRNTYENGREVKSVLDRRFPPGSTHLILLVTSYLHLPRSLLVMKRAGLVAIPAPCDFPETSGKINLFNLIPRISRFSLSTACVHEWLGIAGYRLLGRL